MTDPALSTKHPAQLVRGPQDGAKVHPVGGVLPEVLYVGRVWQGDGFAAWCRKPSARFPMKYEREADHYFFRGEQA